MTDCASTWGPGHQKKHSRNQRYAKALRTARKLGARDGIEPPIKVLQTFAFPVPRHNLIRTEKSAIPFRDCTLSWARSFRMCDEAL